MSRQVKALGRSVATALVLGTAAAVLVACPIPAQAAIGPGVPGGGIGPGDPGGGTAGAATSPTLREILAMVGYNARASHGSGGSGRSHCVWLPGRQERYIGVVPATGGFPQVEGLAADWNTKVRLYGRKCADGVTMWMWVPQVTPQQLAAIGADMVRDALPSPGGMFSPAVTAGQPAMVHLPLWFAVPDGQWSPVSRTASIPGLAATVTARPVRLVFDPGDGGARVSCAGPGLRYAQGMREPAKPPACSYTYRDASVAAPGGSRWPARLSIRWQVSWTATNGAGGGLGPLTTSSTYAVPVHEIQAIEAANRR